MRVRLKREGIFKVQPFDMLVKQNCIPGLLVETVDSQGVRYTTFDVPMTENRYIDHQVLEAKLLTLAPAFRSEILEYYWAREVRNARVRLGLVPALTNNGDYKLVVIMNQEGIQVYFERVSYAP